MPHTINRKSFLISDIQRWKASEIKNFFFYVALPILKSYLPVSNFLNLACIIFGKIYC